MRAHYVNPLTKEEDYSTIGTPQGGTLSPFLSNIYLHELDKFMSKIVKESKDSGPVSKPNPEYKALHTKIFNLRQYFLPSYKHNKSLSEEAMEERKNEIMRLEKLRAKIPSTIPDKGYRVYYVRYADDFLIGVNGTRTRAKKLREKIQVFLKEKLALDLNMEKTRITSAITGRAKFLGAEVCAHTSRTNDQKRRQNSFTSNGSQVRARVPQGRMILLAPLERIVNKLSEQGMCRVIDIKTQDVIPTRKTA